MYEYLRQHPDIFMPERKEPHFFGSDLTITPKLYYYTEDVQEYLTLFAAARNEKRVGEASTTYLKSGLAASEIQKFCPDAKIIIMLRDPIDLMYSLHSLGVYEGSEDIEDFERALDAEEERKRSLKIPTGSTIVDALLYREVAKLSEQVQRYFQAFGRENVHIIIYDDFRDETSAVYGETLRFLGVSLDFQPQFGVIHGNVRARSSVLRYLWAHRPVFLHRLLMGRARPSLPPSILISTLKRIYGQPASRQTLDPELRRRLQDEFKPEVERLSELLGRDLTHWSKEQPA
jgi:hypothetical protein